MPLFPTNPAAAQTGLLGPGIENDPRRPGPGLLQRIGPAAQGLLDTAMIPGERFQGRGTPSVEDAVALSGLMGGGGLLAGRPASSLGVFGGKQRSPKGPPRFMELTPDRGMISQKVKLPTGAEGFVTSIVKKDPVESGLVNLDLNFTVRNPNTGVIHTDMAGLSPKEGRTFFTAAMNEARQHIEKVRPQFVNFEAAHDKLIPIYRKLAKQIAREMGGEAILPGSPRSPFFRVKLPNPRIFKPTGKGLLDPE